MIVSSVNVGQTNAKKGAEIGAAVGIGAGTAYLVKNRQDIFVNTLKSSVEQYGSKKNGIIGCAVAGAATLLATTGVGAAVGSVIGKVADAIKFNKMQSDVKQALADVIQKKLDEGDFETHKMNLSELIAMEQEIEDELN